MYSVFDLVFPDDLRLSELKRLLFEEHLAVRRSVLLPLGGRGPSPGATMGGCPDAETPRGPVFLSVPVL